MSQFDNRFKDAPWYTQCKEELILLVGVGGIGSNALYNLAKTIPAKYYIIDMDVVDAHNIGTQFFEPTELFAYKVNALKKKLSYTSAQINAIQNRYISEYSPITISALDNMKTRKQVFEQWREGNDRQILIDGRLRANFYEVFVVTPGNEDRFVATLFEDTDIDDGPCTFKQTAYFGMLIGARITHILVNYLTNKYSSEPICNIPFRIAEHGELYLTEYNE